MNQPTKKEIENKVWTTAVNRGQMLITPVDDNSLNKSISIKTENFAFGYRVETALNFVSGLSNETIQEVQEKYGSLANILLHLKFLEKNS
ncbi:MAG: hypothetical protein GX638_07230 [Crenarchaeota archaeon]|nr:hypothetical protein [Thermoproteota archaeon]